MPANSAPGSFDAEDHEHGTLVERFNRMKDRRGSATTSMNR
jgi:hypothetical protein